MMHDIEFKILNKEASIPSLATPGSAAYDLRYISPERYSYTIFPGETCLLYTGISIYINNINIAAHVLSRSSLAKNNIVVANAPGLIDSDYQGEIGVLLYNRGNAPYIINHLDKIAQLEFINVIKVKFNIVEEFTEKTIRDAEGFGSTGR